ncbi:PREDICTED: uncharacterized protein LOC108559219 [Nicrophorus vespilloides]|uniref:Uncharacterized protein LOC108559219 n=1 Tax=Nicrophorus vespilloides TaxID=110193 RepID=A0ABM1MBF9_NICVS|nr:PREDICTED: uncharacterized protein LOC108559219 [Nicrophorus vespilloides]
MVLSGWFIDEDKICVMVDGNVVTEVRADKGGNLNWTWLKEVFNIQRRPSLDEVITDWPNLLQTEHPKTPTSSRRPSLADLIPDWPVLHHFTKTEVGCYRTTLLCINTSFVHDLSPQKNNLGTAVHYSLLT